MIPTLISPDHLGRLYGGTIGGKNRTYEGCIFVRKEGQFVWLEGSVLGTAMIYKRVRVMIR
jgi:hypothetical protein